MFSHLRLDFLWLIFISRSSEICIRKSFILLSFEELSKAVHNSLLLVKKKQRYEQKFSLHNEE